MPTVLLADDSATMQKVVDLVLRDQGYEVVSVSNGQEAIDAIASSPPDLVLAYIKLPDGDGYQICQKVKSNPATQSIPVILMAGAFDPVDESMKTQVGADGSIVKPFQAEDLLKIIQAHLGAVAPAAPAEGGGDEVMFEGEDTMSFAGVADEEAAPLGAEPVMAQAAEAEPMLETEALVAETFSGEAYEAEPVMAEPVMEAAPVQAAPAQAAPAQSAGGGVSGVDGARIEAVVREAVEAKVAEAMANLDLKNLVMQSLEPQAKEVLEKLAYEVVPEFLDRIIRGTVSESLTAVNRELENIIWETVPDLAEEMLKKEMKRIRQDNQ